MSEPSSTPRTDALQAQFCGEHFLHNSETARLYMLCRELERSLPEAVIKTREACAALCEVKVKRDAEYQGRFGGYGDFMGDKTGPECAEAIRALNRGCPECVYEEGCTNAAMCPLVGYCSPDLPARGPDHPESP